MSLPIAVIIANRNNGRFLRQCLDSVLAQSLQPKEIVVVDDASTDGSRDILQTYAGSQKIKLILNDTQIGVAASRARAIEQSASPFLTTLDADDYYYGRDKLAAEASVIAVTGRDGIIGFSDVMCVKETGEPVGLVSSRRRIHEGDLSFRLRHLIGFIPRDYLVSRADYLTAGGFDRSFRLYEDWELKVRLCKVCTWSFSAEVGTAYRINPLGLSNSPRKEHIQTMRRIFSMHCPEKTPTARAFAKARFFVHHSMYLRRLAL